MTLSVLVNFAIILAGLYFVGESSKFVIDKSTKLAKLFNISEFIIGFILLAVATSLPELAVAIMSVIQGETALTIGNLMGSSISDIGILISLGAIYTVIYIKREELLELTAILFFTAVIPSVLLFAPQFKFFVGLALILFFIIFSWRAITKKEMLEEHSRSHEHIKKNHFFDPSIWKNVAMLFAGITVLLTAAYFVVHAASAIAYGFGVPEAFIGATIVTIGTLLPEMAVTINGLRLGRHSLVIGNAVGSVMTNIGLILGFVLVSSPFTIKPIAFMSLAIFLIGFNAMLWVLIRDKKVTRLEGIILLAFYIFYMLTLTFNSMFK